MDLGLSSLALSFAAGLASVASPCVLPVLPLVVRWASGALLVVFGLVILQKGMLFAGMLPLVASSMGPRIQPERGLMASIWDERFAGDEYVYDTAPNVWLAP